MAQRRRHGRGKDVDYTKRAIHINKLVFANTRYRSLVRLLPWRKLSTEILPLIRSRCSRRRRRHRRRQTSRQKRLN